MQFAKLNWFRQLPRNAFNGVKSKSNWKFTKFIIPILIEGLENNPKTSQQTQLIRIKMK
jgi:hypothetical protein